ncbi:MAG: sulfurtransferase TusA family protein [Ferrovum sp.]|nr:sulfurtransferase TusA family protein [Ferrovum sp.]NDU88021.1 sulfurtransferase TusA family protein [Ferrovum sp.]
MSSPLAPSHHIFLDLQGLTCPGPLLGVKRMIDTLEANQVVLLLSDCPGTHDDLLAWTKQTANQLLYSDKLEGSGGHTTRYFVQKGRLETLHPHATLDMRGIVCPGPIVEAKRLLDGMKAGEVLKLISNCPGIRSDITGWAMATHLRLINTVESAHGEYEFLLQKS